ncbi:MAG: hypothetical protein JW846_09850 [Dehalococcoidia bacterium]|nr:hypothetical protein [Dehalococcoidia bacterium]
MHYRKTFQRTSALLIALFLVVTTTSCGGVDEFKGAKGHVPEEAGDIVGDVTDIIGDVTDMVKGAIAEHGTPESSGSQTVSRPPRPTGTISTGDRTSLTSATIGSSGGTVTVTSQGDPLDGLEIQVPSGAYADPKPFQVSSAPIESHDFGAYFTPATPLISIENGGAYSEEFMTVTIPVEVPPDHFAMAFYYDDAAGTLEGIPTGALDDHSITIVTRHFTDIIVSIINNTLLDDLMKSDIDSHFRPGIDDWQFTNYGSYIAKGGHCAGQCLTELWYFCEQPDGQDLTLNGRYDKNGVKPATPDLWQDDSYSYRLASTVQKDINWSSFQNKFMTNLAGVDDEMAYKAFAYSIYLTGEPQEVGIFSNAGGGHDMICYRVHNNSLYIADPNYPGNTDRRIEYSNGNFKPYNSGANAAEIEAGNGKAYETIQYCAKSATVDWKTIAARWNEFKAGTAGNDRFPQYQVVIVDHEGNEKALTDGYKSKEQKIRILVKSDATIGTKVYRNGTRITPDSNGRYELEEGNNLIGIDIWGDVNNNPQNRDYCYIDFQYLNVQYGASECHGWVLDSIEEKVCSARDVDEYDLNLDFTATADGSYSGSGTKILPTSEGDIMADYSVSGSWVFPDCLRPGETAEFTLSCSSSLTLSRPIEWCSISNHLTAGSPEGEIDTISQLANSAEPTVDDSMTIEWQCPYDGWPGQSFELYANCSSEAGWATYVYTYVWQD